MDIFEAARTNNVEELAAALHTTHPNQTDSRGSTALTIACYYNNKEAAKLLLDAGAAPDLIDGMGNSALMGACFKGNYEVASLLLAAGATIDMQNANSATALTFAATFGQSGIVKLLLEKGANPFIKDRFGKNPVDYAEVQHNELCYEMLAAAANSLLQRTTV